jgi:hypothetical protein
LFHQVVFANRTAGYCAGIAPTNGDPNKLFPMIMATHSAAARSESPSVHHVVAQDLQAPFELLKRDLYPPAPADSVHLVRDWHSPHCAAGAKAVASRCVALAGAQTQTLVKKRHFLRHLLQNASFYQDRLGTNIGKTQKKSGASLG